MLEEQLAVLQRVVHLASALTRQENLGERVTLATFDRDLWLAVGAAGLAVWPETP